MHKVYHAGCVAVSETSSEEICCSLLVQRCSGSVPFGTPTLHTCIATIEQVSNSQSKAFSIFYSKDQREHTALRADV